MTGYLFESDIVSSTFRRRPSAIVADRLAAVPRTEQFVSAITLGELLFGATRVGRVNLLVRIEAFLPRLARVLPFDEQAARIFGPLKADLQRLGTPLDEADLRIASIALANDLTMVTGNVRHFARVPGLGIENWLDASG